MMTSVFKYAYPHAKVRAMKGRLLSEERFQALLHTDTFEELLNILRTTSYADALEHLPLPEITPGELTGLLYKSVFEDYEKTIRSVDPSLRPLCILLYQRYELINLKMILRGIISQVNPQDVAALLLPTERYTLFSKETLLQFRDVHGVIEHLQGTFFQYPLNQALRRFDEEQEFFPLEMALDLHYYHTLWDALKKLPEQEKQIAKQILGMQVDILNLSWIIRFKEEYRFSPEEILNYTIHHGNVFILRERRYLAETSNVGEILDFLRKKTIYSKAFPKENIPLNTLHIYLNRYFADQLRKFFFGNPFQFGLILGYLLLKEFEISDIMTIVEAKKYGFSLEQSQYYVIHAGSELK